MDHLALPVTDQERSRRFYETYLGRARPARRSPDGVLMLYDARGFALALGPPSHEAPPRPDRLHFGVALSHASAVRALRDRLAADGVELVEAWDEPNYASVKCRDPDGYIVEAFWEPERGAAAALTFPPYGWKSARSGIRMLRRCPSRTASSSATVANSRL